MKEFRDWLAQCSLAHLEFPLDAQIHRFNKDGGKKNGWFWGTQIFATSTGEPIIICSIGDWKVSNEAIWEFRSNRPLSKDDKKVIDTKIKQGREKAEKEKAILHGETAQECEALWKQLGEGLTQYSERKLLPEPFGTRCGVHEGKPFIAVPCRDIEGKLWGMQRIFEDGSKYFTSGQRVVGTFHEIGGSVRDADQLLICEGFATACSLFLATKIPVICAFNAGNLCTVSKLIRSLNPNAAITICGDDDRWLPEDKGNPGREKAEAAATEILAAVVFPVFKDTTSRPTDFNDLHALEGLEEVSQQLGIVKPVRNYVIALGHKKGKYFYTSSENAEIVEMTDHSRHQLMNLMPRAYWENRYLGAKGIQWEEAADDLMTAARSRGHFNEDQIRGLGVWQDEGRTILHLGNRLWVDGRIIGLREIKTRHVYELRSTQGDPHASALTLSELAPLTDLIATLRIKRTDQRMMLLGWLGCAKLCAMLQWRPQIWITGPAGCGKTTLMRECVRPLMGAAHYAFEGNTTEAAMRQTIEADAVPVTYDEFEPRSPDQLSTVRRCLDLVRQASSSSAMIVKGSATGKPVRFRARFCTAVSSIQVLLDNQADVTRFAVVDMHDGEVDGKQWIAVQKCMNQFGSEYCARFFKRILQNVPRFVADLQVFTRELGQRHGQRYAEQYAPLLAGAALLTTDDRVDAEGAARLADMLHADTAPQDHETDHDECYQHLLAKQVSHNGISRSDETVSHCILQARTEQDFKGAYGSTLMRYGMRLKLEKGQIMLFVSNKNPQLADLFRNTLWQAGWTTSLRRIKGAIPDQVRIGDHSTRGTSIPV